MTLKTLSAKNYVAGSWGGSRMKIQLNIRKDDKVSITSGLMGLLWPVKVKNPALLFLADANFPSDIYIKASTTENADAFPVTVDKSGRGTIRSAKALVRSYLRTHLAMGDDGWMYPVKPSGEKDVFAVCVKQGAKTDRFRK